MNTVYTILSQTPIWVYILFAYLVFVGIKASHTGVVSIYKLAALPVIFFILALETLMTHFSINATNVGVFVFSLVLGSAIGYILVFKQHLVTDNEHKLLKLPGSWLTLVLVLIIFFSKYYSGYQLALYQDSSLPMHLVMVILGINGLCAGTFVGRILFYWRRMSKGPNENLADTK